MLAKLVGYFAIALGVLWLIWPHILRGWAVRKTSWTVFGALFFLLFYPLAHWAMVRWGIRGWLGVFFGFLIFGGVLGKLIRKGAEKLPMPCFQVIGVLNILSGISLIWGRV